MSTIRLRLENHAYLKVIECPDGIVEELREHFTFPVPNAKYIPSVRKKLWDGKIRLFNKLNGELNAGLWSNLVKFCKDRGYELEVEETEFGYPGTLNKVSKNEIVDWIDTLEDLPHKPHNHQLDALLWAIKHKRTVMISPTASGKSFLTYLLLRWYMRSHSKRILIIVPTTSLVEQLYKDFRSYGFEPDNYCQMIYSGHEKLHAKPIIISTWQSIYKLKPNWFEPFGMIVGDECHLFKAKSLSSIMNKAINAEYRFGVTGTLDGKTVHRLQLTGLFGPIKRVVKTKELQEKGILAPLKIDVIKINHHDKDRYDAQNGKSKLEYQDEIDWLVRNEKRNKFIRDLTLTLNGNTLVLFNFVEKHGKVLRDMLQTKIDDERRLYYVDGNVDTATREQIRAIVERESDAIIVASYGTYSTGINIKNIHNIVFASPSNSVIRVLQSIGRGLRVSDDGRTTRLFDIGDNLTPESEKMNSTLRHLINRIEIYKKEEFQFRFIEVSL